VIARFCTATVVIVASLVAGPMRVADQQRVMGTHATVVAYAWDRAAARRAIATALCELRRIERLMSVRDPGSPISRLNRQSGAGMIVDPEVFAVLTAARHAGELSDGAFDVTVGPLLGLWRQAGKHNRLPAPSEVAAARERVGWRRLQLDPTTRTVRFAVPGVRIDLGGIAKGYGIDRALAKLRQESITAGLVDVGGDLAVFGAPPGRRGWRVGVQDPFGPGYVTRLVVRDAAVATSGNYLRHSTIAGRRYSHIVDPRTGRPADAVPSVTVIAPSALAADWLATALSVTGVPGLARLAGQGGEVEALLIVGHAKQWRAVRSRGFGSYESGPTPATRPAADE
jgi:FAD:protein FMN transferase